MKQPKKKKVPPISNQKIGAMIRKAVEEKKRAFAQKFKVGEFVKEKWAKDTIGLIVEEVTAKKRYTSGMPLCYIGGSIDYVAERYFNYTVKVLWMHHPTVIEGRMDQVTDMHVDSITVRKETKQKKVLES